MFQLLHNCTHPIRLQSNTQNSPSKASAVLELWTSTCSSWINCQHHLDHEKNKRIPEKNVYFSFIDYTKAFLCVDHNKLWKILKEMGIPDHITCLLRNLYAGQEVIVRTRDGTTDWFQIGKGVHQGCILSPCLFNLYVEYIMWNVRLDEAQTEIKIARRNINNLRCANDTTLMAESNENKTASWWRWKRRVKKLAENSTFRKLRSWPLVPSLYGK